MTEQTTNIEELQTETSANEMNPGSEVPQHVDDFIVGIIAEISAKDVNKTHVLITYDKATDLASVKTLNSNSALTERLLAYGIYSNFGNHTPVKSDVVTSVVPHDDI